jgi:hypothetical protein
VTALLVTFEITENIGSIRGYALQTLFQKHKVLSLYLTWCYFTPLYAYVTVTDEPSLWINLSPALSPILR